jgi:transposase-like protein
MSIEKQSDIEQRKFWEMAIETWQSSGIPVRQFCRQEGLSEPSFYSWRRKLRADKPKHKPAPSDFVEVSLPDPGSSPLELVLKSGNVLRISSSTDKELLSRVIGVLHEAGLC